MLWQECCELPWQKRLVACAGRRSFCNWGAGGSGFVLELWRYCQAGSQQPPGCITLWAVDLTFSNQHSPLLNTYCFMWRSCVQLWASCCGNGSWSKFSRGQQPAEVSKVEPGFAQWSMVGRQKTPDINCKKRGSGWTEGEICSWWGESGNGAAAQRRRLCTLSSEAFKARADKTHSNLVSPCSEPKETRGPFHPELR